MRIIILFFALLLCSPAAASIHGSVPVSSYNDGSTGYTVNGVSYAPPAVPSFYGPTRYGQGFYTYATSSTLGVGSDQSWTSAQPWSWKASGWGYGIGYDQTYMRKDPTTTIPTYCTYYPSGNHYGTNPELYCNGGTLTSPIDIENYKFGPSYPGDTTKCVTLYVGGTENLSAPIIKNNYFGNGPGCLSTVVTGSIANSVLTVTAIAYQNQPISINQHVNIDDPAVPVRGDITANAASGGTPCNGAACTGNGGVGTYALSGATTTAAQTMQIGVFTPQVTFATGGVGTQGQYDVIWANNEMDGHARPSDTYCGGPCSDGGVFDNHTAGHRTVIYSVFLAMPGRPWGGNGLGSTTAASLNTGTDYDFDYVEGISLNGFGVHGEFLEEVTTNGAIIPNTQYIGFVLLTPHYPALLNAPMFISSGGAPGPTWQNVTVDHSIIIGNKDTTNNVYINSEILELNRNTYNNVVWSNNFIDPTMTLLYCAALVTSPTVLNSTFTNNVTLTFGDTISAYNVSRSADNKCN